MVTSNTSVRSPGIVGSLPFYDVVQISLIAPPHLHNKLNPSAESAEGFFAIHKTPSLSTYYRLFDGVSAHPNIGNNLP